MRDYSIMVNRNIVLDFTVNKSIESLTAGQALAVMPAALAQKLLMEYAKGLIRASSMEIILNFKDSINIQGTVTEAVQTAIEFIQERELIENCATGNWDAYAVDEVEETMDTIMGDLARTGTC